MTAKPKCMGCESEKLGFPCQTDGVFDPQSLAKEYVDQIPDETTENDDLHWSYNCMAELVESHPALAWETILAAARRSSTKWQAMMLAAGPLEDLIATHGPDLIDRIEGLSRRSSRFRFILSGVWPQGNSETEVWSRILAARTPGPHIDSDAALPVSDI